MSSCLKIQFGLITLGKSGMKKNAAMAIGTDMIASIVKIHRHPGKPLTP
jgi:hypothetical protein